ncbi:MULTISPECIES: sodium:solute symporter [Petrimonas]|jgi:Na+/proline symporter|uniref:sodium:solute symporter n=1 Tax=Petrimonas TaxID=307628 RepID=UPI0008F43F55|nr:MULTISPECIES: sodium:solute symporter [Petrimonas]MDD3560158.1 sodium:solute symporter [Petrimonas mucosa]SFU27884.1 Na+/proline symporter [Porphyromonadaceae bacterium KHP3R9]HHT29393.1 sodium:solute symporter [Petrimonas mucosa]
MQSSFILVVIAAYFLMLMLISYLTSRKGSDNDAFFRANRSSKWYVVAFAMIGTSISGVTFVSVPGMVRNHDMTYMQMVLGFFFGYLVIAYVLLPLYYKLNLTTIYGYLGQRYGRNSYKTGAWFFLLSKIVGAAARLYLVAFILQSLVFDAWGVPFVVTVIGIILVIWLYSHKSGIKTIIWTDWIQTLLFLTALVLIIWQVTTRLGFGWDDTFRAITANRHARIFVFDDWASTQHFFKQFFSGMFITIVMTGLDQDQMQKNLTIKSLKDARRNVISYGLAFAPINLLFLSLGVLLLIFAEQNGIALPDVSDNILPVMARGHLGQVVLGIFVTGIVAAAFSSADSALTALTTSFCVDILEMGRADNPEAEHRNIATRRHVHLAISTLFVLIILLIEAVGSDSIITAIYKLASYTYGPLLGLYFCGLYTRVKPVDKWVPYVAVAAPLLCFVFETGMKLQFGYQVGYELLLVNAALTGTGLWILSLNPRKL